MARLAPHLMSRRSPSKVAHSSQLIQHTMTPPNALHPRRLYAQSVQARIARLELPSIATPPVCANRLRELRFDCLRTPTARPRRLYHPTLRRTYRTDPLDGNTMASAIHWDHSLDTVRNNLNGQRGTWRQVHNGWHHRLQGMERLNRMAS